MDLPAYVGLPALTLNAVLHAKQPFKIQKAHAMLNSYVPEELPLSPSLFFIS